MNLSGTIPPGGSLALIVKYATHPRETQPGSNKPAVQVKLRSQPKSSSFSQSQPPPGPPHTKPRDQNSVFFSTDNTPSSFSGKVAHFLPTKQRSSDWIETFPQPCAPPALPLSLSHASPSFSPLSSTSPIIIVVMIIGIPESLDLMDFHFLSEYGRVLKGKRMTREIEVYYPEDTSMNYETITDLIEFSVEVNSYANSTHLLSLHDTTIIVQGHSLMVSFLLFPSSLPCLVSLLCGQVHVSRD
jgi:hypothetical protein